MLQGLREYIKKKETELTMAVVAAAVVIIVYVVVSLIVWNEANFSYAIIFAIVTFLLYFIFNRLLRYLITKKEGVIKEHK